MMKLQLFWTILAAFTLGPVQAQDLAQAKSENMEAETLFEKGEVAYRAADHLKAIAYYDQVIALDKDHLNAYLQRGFCHGLTKQYAKAVADFTAVITRKPDHLWAYTSRGSAYNKLEQYDKAMKDFDKVIIIDPKNEEAYNNRGWTKKALGDPKAACKDWKASQRMGNAEAKIILKNNQCK